MHAAGARDLFLDRTVARHAHRLGHRGAQPLPLVRCAWATSELGIPYHDNEWGTPQHDDNVLFEFILLEGAQAGLSWETILRKREGYRRAFAGFDPAKVARFTPARVEKLMLDPSIVRHRGKIESAITNARAFLAVQKQFGSFGAYLWKFVDGRPVVHRAGEGESLPAESELSARISKDLKQRGFQFVGSTIVYAYLQAMGVVDDHYAYCFRAKKALNLSVNQNGLGVKPKRP